jgi:hypothetical protein
MSHPLIVMDGQTSLKQYIRECGLPEPGPFVLIDEDTVVRLAAKAMGQELPPEACYLEQLWLRVDPGESSTPPDQGGGTPAWVPANARIHIDFLGGAPQGRAWVDGTGAVALDALLGSDPNTDIGYGLPSGYSSGNLSADGCFSFAHTCVAFIGAARTLLLAGATVRVVFKQADTVQGSAVPLALAAADGNNAWQVDISITPMPTKGSIAAEPWNGTPVGLSSLVNVVNIGIGAMNGFAFTITNNRSEAAINGGVQIISYALTATMRPPGSYVSAVFDVRTGYGAVQSITIYDPLPSTAGLSALSALT